MQIYCDESGGFDGNKHSLVVSAVRISSHDAARLMKKFRKASKLAHEIKGGLLSEKHRQIFFDMLAEIEHFGAAVGCHRASTLGSIVQNCYSESDVYQNMLMEACAPLFDASIPKANVYADGGRYSKQIYSQIGASLESALSTASFSAQFDFVRSENSAGVQVADILANTVYKATAAATYDLSSHAVCGALFKSGRLLVLPADLGVMKPSWLAAE